MERFNWRYASSDDYESILLRWWGEWGFSAPVKEFLPERGIIVSGRMAAASEKECYNYNKTNY